MHLIIDGYGSDQQVLQDEQALRQLLDSYPSEIGMNKISEIERTVSMSETSGTSSGGRRLKTALLLSKAIMKASLERRESRGAFYREDFSHMDDVNWRKHILLRFDAEKDDFLVTHQPVEQE